MTHSFTPVKKSVIKNTSFISRLLRAISKNHDSREICGAVIRDMAVQTS
jgi:hypothetical protein